MIIIAIQVVTIFPDEVFFSIMVENLCLFSFATMSATARIEPKHFE